MVDSPKIYVKACINGARTPDQHPNLPVTPEQLAAAALAAHGAGAKAGHMHPKTPPARGPAGVHHPPQRRRGRPPPPAVGGGRRGGGGGAGGAGPAAWGDDWVL